MTKEELLARHENLKQEIKECDEAAVAKIKEFLKEIIAFVSLGRNKVGGLVFADISEIYHFWYAYLSANHISISIGEFPVSLILLYRSK